MSQVSALPSQLVNQANNALPTNTLELKDIHLPEQIANYPVAYGWWLLATLIIFMIVVTLIKIRKTAKRNQVKKQALAQLKRLQKNNTEMTNSDIIALLKWAAMHYFSRAELAKLFGDSLQQFLLSKLSAKHQQTFVNLSEQAFANQYHANKDAKLDENFLQGATLWLNQALPPKPLKNSSQGVDA